MRDKGRLSPEQKAQLDAVNRDLAKAWNELPVDEKTKRRVLSDQLAAALIRALLPLRGTDQ